MPRYWVSWYSGNYADEGCTKPPFQFWCSGTRDRPGDTDKDDEILCAVIDAIGFSPEKDIHFSLKQHFPDYTIRFLEKKPDGWQPGDRFPGFENRTSLGFFTHKPAAGFNPPAEV